MDFLLHPNLPTGAVQAVLVDYRTDKEIIKALKNLNIDVYLSCKIENLQKSVNGHADMGIHHIGKECFVCEPSVCQYYQQLFGSANIKLIRGNTCLTSTYPQDAAYNVARVGNFAFHKIKYTDKTILDMLCNTNVTIINTAQGYSKCNICPINENAIITEDESVFRTAQKYGIDVLKISKGYVQLDGFSYGFFGGATGLISKGKLAVTGNIHGHSDYDKIVEFCKKYCVQIVELTNSKPIDIGSILPIYEQITN